MKTESILLQLSLLPNKYNKEQIKQLIDVAAMLKSLTIESIKVTDCEMMLGKRTEENRWRRSGERYILSEGDKVSAQCFEVTTKTGYYKQIVPINNDLHREFCNILKIELNQVDDVCLSNIQFNKQETDILKKAAAFTEKKNDLRPAFNHIKIEVKKNGFNIVATDGYRLYKKFISGYVCGPEYDVLINPKLLTKKQTDIKVFDGYLLVNGQKQIIDNSINYPDYSAVWPVYNQFVEVDKNELQIAIKSVMATANKITHVINLEINGLIKINTEDLDFNHESNYSVLYKQKTMPDFNISFNGKFFLEALKALPEKTVKIYHNGDKAKRAIILNKQVLLMSVQPKYY